MLIICSIFAFKSINYENPDLIEFEEQLKSGYDEYVLYEQNTNNYYDLKIYVGKYKEKIYYSIYFRNEIPNQPYNIKLSYKNKTYNLKKTQRGDVFEPAVAINNASSFSIEVYDVRGGGQPRPEFANLSTISLEEFANLEGRIPGKGEGFTLSRMKSDIYFDTSFIIYIALVAVLIVCGLIIFIFYKKKKGMFNSDLRSANVFNFKEFLNSVQKDTFTEQVEEEVIYEETNFEDTENPHISEEPKEKVVHQTYIWQHYEEEKSDFDIKKHLRVQNLPTDYRLASIEDKNKVMIELMRLRDQGKITQDDYLDEISELWKS
jgi:hypothetical protein